jgi:hypothetical protein
MMLADVAFDLSRPSRRWLLLLSLLVHALVIVSVVWVQLTPDRLTPEPHAFVCHIPRPSPLPSPICRTWVVKGDTRYCGRYYEIPREAVQLTCSRLSPEVVRAMRMWPYRADPCAMWRKTTEQGLVTSASAR